MREKFQDRTDAGRQLAARLTKYAHREDVIVLGLPRGGVPVAFEIARKLSAPLDVFVVRKLGLPGHRELAMGAIASGGIRIINERVVGQLGVSEDIIDQVAAEEKDELDRREMAYRGHSDGIHLQGLTVILVDDGIATGSTMRAVIAAISKQHPARLIVAVPAAASEPCYEIKPMVDELIVLMMPDDFYAVGQWYRDFSQTTDAEVTRLLQESGRDLDLRKRKIQAVPTGI